ncbi:MAG: hypothetical protein EBT08_15110 [Betaproteobacteria bacterium]|nr:hypothetical protein [Betaproteobacteria bacterium]
MTDQATDQVTDQVKVALLALQRLVKKVIASFVLMHLMIHSVMAHDHMRAWNLLQPHDLYRLRSKRKIVIDLSN